MSRRKLARSAAALIACGGLGIASMAASTGAAAAAGPGPSAMYQVEVSVSGHNVVGNGTGTGVRVSATLFSGGSVRYQETDSAHHLMMTGAMHNTGGGATWFDNTATGWLVIKGIQTGMGPVIIKIPDYTGHFTYPMETQATGHPLFTLVPSNPKMIKMDMKLDMMLNSLPGQGQVAP